MVCSDLSGNNPKARAEVGHQCLAAEHVVGDTVAEKNVEAAHWLGMQETIKACYAFNVGQWQIHLIGNMAEQLAW